MRRPYESAGKQYRYVAIVCPACPAAFDLAGLGLKKYDHLLKPATTGGTRTRPKPGVTGDGAGRPLLHWVKTTDPAMRVPRQPPGTDARVILPSGSEFDALRTSLADAGVAYRQVRHWLEDETITTVGARGRPVPLRASAGRDIATGTAATSARDAFEMIWDAHGDALATDWTPVEAATLVPAEWVPYLPYPGLNPLQVQAASEIVEQDGHVIVTAPTGSGKTVIGMLAAIKALLGQGRKVAWLVPQRSLTDELDRELASWREQGVRVERLSGEHATDMRKIREANVWVATTEKFEALCRTASLTTALAEVACLVVDEIHLLGDPARGPLLEALLARVAGSDSRVRIVGLSATVSNAAEIAGWLGARLVTSGWRPSRLTWQLLTIPDGADHRAQQLARTETAVAVADRIVDDGGSVLVFCGSKRAVRATALAVAAARGANTRGVSPDDLARLEKVCSGARVGIHYKDWDHKAAAERGFRTRDLDVLVATTTVAAGVNLPARAVVVQDTQLGITTMGVATVQQMFGRAGRIGAGETEGWGYLITTRGDRSGWQQDLVDGYVVRSRLDETLPDHLLAETAQGRMNTVTEAENWWVRTLANHKGTRDLEPVHAAVQTLLDGGFLAATTHEDGSSRFAVTELGRLTTRLMVGVQTGIRLRTHLAAQPAPSTAEDAESLLIRAVATQVPQFSELVIGEEHRQQVTRLLRAQGHVDRLSSELSTAGSVLAPGDLAQVTFLLVANTPRACAGRPRTIAGLPYSVLFSILSEAPHYFAWLAEQGGLATVQPWVAVVAADLGRRIRWRVTAPPRGAGRLLWICEQMATREHADRLVPQLFGAARRAEITSPDWPVGAPPRACQLTEPLYRALLADRAAAVDDAGEPVVFGRRGDYRSRGWLASYNEIAR